jgi:hypothetical protein
MQGVHLMPITAALWRERLKNALAEPCARERDHLLSDLAYEAVGTEDPELVDGLFSVFELPLDSSLLQSFVNALGSTSFELYSRGFARRAGTLLSHASTWAASLVDYPGRQVTQHEVQALVDAVFAQQGGRSNLATLQALVLDSGLASDEPWRTFARATPSDLEPRQTGKPR